MENSKWLENLRKSPYPTPPRSHAEPKAPNVPLEFADLAKVDEGDVSVGDRSVTGQIPLGGDTPHPIEEFFQNAQRDLLNKNSGVVDAPWDAPLAKRAAAAPVTAFSEKSKERFEKACSVIRRVFADKPEACEEAIDIAKQMLVDARAEVLAAAAA